MYTVVVLRERQKFFPKCKCNIRNLD